MSNGISFRRQQFYLLALTLSLIAAVTLFLGYHDKLHRDTFKLIANHQQIVYHIGKAREELREIEQQFLFRQLYDDPDADQVAVFAGTSLRGEFDRSISIHVLNGHITELLRLQKETASHGPLSLKLERQFDDLTRQSASFVTIETADIERLKLRIEGLILSMVQLEGIHNLRIDELTREQAAESRGDTLLIIILVTTLVLLSYLSITWVMNRIRSTVEEQRVLARELERKNAELERFTYTVSHDLKSPLVTIKNFIGMLERNVRTDDRRQAYQDLEHISDAADEMAALLEGLLELSRIGRIVNPPQAGRLNELVDQAVKKLQGKIEARGVELQVEADMPEYWGDDLRLQEVFQNLIENAVKFMGDQPAPKIWISARLQDGDVLCLVRDNGIGIDQKFEKRVFNLFERLDQKVEGTGIGLALVQRIVEAHHGKVWIESNMNSPGCTVAFTLPLRLDNSDEP